jgi:hypothetical protein
MNRDMTYCIASECPFVDCERHIERLKGLEVCVSTACFAGTCRRYIAWLVDEVKGGQNA